MQCLQFITYHTMSNHVFQIPHGSDTFLYTLKCPLEDGGKNAAKCHLTGCCWSLWQRSILSTKKKSWTIRYCCRGVRPNNWCPLMHNFIIGSMKRETAYVNTKNIVFFNRWLGILMATTFTQALTTNRVFWTSLSGVFQALLEGNHHHVNSKPFFCYSITLKISTY